MKKRSQLSNLIVVIGSFTLAIIILPALMVKIAFNWFFYKFPQGEIEISGTELSGFLTVFALQLSIASAITSILWWVARTNTPGRDNRGGWAEATRTALVIGWMFYGMVVFLTAAYSIDEIL